MIPSKFSSPVVTPHLSDWIHQDLCHKTPFKRCSNTPFRSIDRLYWSISMGISQHVIINSYHLSTSLYTLSVPHCQLLNHKEESHRDQFLILLFCHAGLGDVRRKQPWSSTKLQSEIDKRFPETGTTPQKTNMEPENDMFEREIICQTSIVRFHASLQECKAIY